MVSVERGVCSQWREACALSREAYALRGERLVLSVERGLCSQWREACVHLVMLRCFYHVCLVRLLFFNWWFFDRIRLCDVVLRV